MSAPSRRAAWEEVACAWFPAEVAFVLMPLSLYLSNQADFEHDLSLVLPYLAAAAIALAGSLSLLLVRPALRGRLATGLFFGGVYLALRDVLSPVQMGEMRDTILLEPIRQPPSLIAVDVALALAALLAAIKLRPEQVRRPGAIVVAVVLMTEVLTVARQLSKESTLFEQPAATVPPPAPLASRGNIYHVTFDAFSSLILMDAVRYVSSPRAFDGFTFFSGNRSNYDYTTLSAASFMTGRLYRSGSLQQFFAEARQGGLIRDLRAAGHEIWQYVPGRTWIHPGASHVATTSQFQRKYRARQFSFADLWFLRLAPQYLKRAAFDETKGVFSRLAAHLVPTTQLDTTPVASAEMLRQLIADEAKRPRHGQYVHSHIYLPHFPYVLDDRCQYRPGLGYGEQAACAVRLMAELIAALKKQGKYHDALIIFQSDHGTSSIGPSDRSLEKLSAEMERELTRKNLLGVDGWGVANLSRSLLLIKPPGRSGAPLEISDRPTQLADLPATVHQLLGLPAHQGDGRPAFGDWPPGDREVPFFVGFDQKDARGRLLRFGTTMSTGEMNHFGVSPTRGWRTHPNIPAKWR